MAEFTIDKETAEQEFQTWADAWEIDTEVENMNEEEREDYEGQKVKILRAMRFGRMCYEQEADRLVYTGAYMDDPLPIVRPKGAGLMEMDRYKDREGVHKTYAVLGTMTKKNAAFFAKLDGIDLKPILAVLTLFLAG